MIIKFQRGNVIRMAVLLLCLFCTSSIYSQAHFRFGGTWRLNESRSQFGNVPKYAAVSMYSFSIKDSNLTVRWNNSDSSGNESTHDESITLDGRASISLTSSGNITRRTKAILSENGDTLTIETMYSKPGTPDIPNYQIRRIFVMQNSDQEIYLNMKTPGYSLGLIYEKEKTVQ
jgi:hypothetical protein